MINNTLRSEDFQSKQEGDINRPKSLKHTTTSRQWGGVKNPRIVRVSRAFGGKDRHSKVYTVKGLRDRRIRLSVPTAIQLYGLQDKLGLTQPSKVIDWLLDVTKDDIDKLPPLQIPLGDFNLHLQSSLVPQDLNSPQLSFSPFFSTPSSTFVNEGNRTLMYTKQGTKMGNDHGMNIDQERAKGKEVVAENKWSHDQEHGGLNFFPITQSSYPSLSSYNSYYNWEPTSNLSLSQFGSSHSSVLPSSFAPPSQLQYFSRPSVATTSPFFPNSYPMATFGEHNDPIRQPNHFQFLSSSSPHVLPNSHVHEPLIDSQEKVPFGLNINFKVHQHKQ